MNVLQKFLGKLGVTPSQEGDVLQWRNPKSFHSHSQTKAYETKTKKKEVEALRARG